MSELATIGNALPPATAEVLRQINELESKIMQFEDGLPLENQFRPEMEHVLHAGMYSRTCRLRPNFLVFGTLMKIPTLFMVHGNALVFAGDRWYEINGYQVIAACAGRKQVVYTFADTEFTMIFATSAKTVQEAEAEFTDETEKLLSRRQQGNASVTIT